MKLERPSNHIWPRVLLLIAFFLILLEHYLNPEQYGYLRVTILLISVVLNTASITGTLIYHREWKLLDAAEKEIKEAENDE